MKRAFFSMFLLATSLQGVAADTGTTAANFLKLGIGPRAIAMGEAQTGLADDIYAAYWNPAGLAGLSAQQAGFVHTQYLQDINEQYLAYAFPKASIGTFAGSFSYLNVGKFEGFDAAGQPIGEVGANDAAAGFSFARSIYLDRRLGTFFSAGVTGKWIQERLDTVSAKAYAADAGILFSPGRKWGEALEGWRGGLMVQNIGTPLKFDDESFALPRSVNAGLSYSGSWLGQPFSLAVDGRQPNAGPQSVGGGMEIWALQVLVLRAGYTTQSDLGNGLRLGGGVRFKGVQIDYGYANAGDLGGAHRIGLTLVLGKTQQDPELLAQRWYEKGLRDVHKKRFTEALVEFNKALEIDPSHPEALKMMKETYDEIKTMVPE